MKIEKISIDKIKPYENNAKLHPPEQIEQIKKSIQDFGNNDPIAVDENSVIIEGHGRYQALKELGFKDISNAFTWITISLTCNNCGKKYKRFIDFES